MLHELIDLYCLIPETSHIDDIIRTAPSRMLNTSPNSFSISRIAKKDGCNIKYTESPIASGANSKAEMETPSSIFLIVVIYSIKLSIKPKMFSRALSVVGDAEMVFLLLLTFSPDSSSPLALPSLFKTKPSILVLE